MGRPATGGIRKRGERFQAYWSEGGCQVSKTFDTSREAQAHLDRINAQKLLGTFKPAVRLRFEDVFERWLVEYSQRNHTRGVQYQVARYGRANLVPYFGRQFITDVRRSDIPGWVGWCEERDISPWSIRESYNVLRGVLSYAVEVEMIDTFPFTRQTSRLLPRAEKRERTLLSVSEVKALAEAMPPELESFVLLVGYCGLRPSEALALERSDVDLDAGVIHLSKVVVRGILQPQLKNGSTYRRVDIPEVVALSLRRHLAWFSSRLLFPSGAGTHRHETNVNTTFKRVAAKLGINACVYDLRHSAATTMVEHGGQRYAQEQLGHRSPTITLGIYAKVSASGRNVAREAMNKALG